MQSKIAFCSRCRGMKAGWNKRYVWHCLLCRKWLRNSSKLGTLAILTAALLLAFPEPSASVSSEARPVRPVRPAASLQAEAASDNSAVRSMEAFLKRHQVRAANRSRLAESIVASATKYDLDPRLIASITVVESRGDAFAISGKAAVGIMQIHLPTWGATADREGVNLFKIEDNIDFGARILKGYVHQYGRWEGVKRYNGFIRGNPASEQYAEEYAAKVQRVYDLA